MKRAVWALAVAAPLLALLAFGLRGNPRAIASPLVNKPAPGFTLRTLDGRPVSLTAFRGRPIVLNFWASWCLSCRLEHAALRDAWHRYRTRVYFVGILFQDTPSGARTFMTRYGGEWPSLQDPGQDAAIGYGVAGPPETYFIDRHGIVRFKVVGPLTAGVLERNITRLLRVT